MINSVNLDKNRLLSHKTITCAALYKVLESETQQEKVSLLPPTHPWRASSNQERKDWAIKNVLLL